MVKRGRVDEDSVCPNVSRHRALITTYSELGTERLEGNRPIPVSKIREYLLANRLPDYWYPILTQIDRNQIDLEADNGN